MARLRGPDGCPWDREQTIQSLRPFVLEETYEVLDAIDRGDHDALRGEIGDLLFEGVFLAQIEADEGRFTVSDSLRDITAKLIRRHPHVFGTAKDVTHAGPGARAMGADQGARAEARRPDAGRCCAACRRRCRRCSARTKSAPASPRSASTGRKTERRRGQDRGRGRRAEARGRGRRARRGSKKRWATCSSRSPTSRRKLGIEPESALRKANQKFSARFQQLEQHLEAQGRSVHDASLEEMEEIWQTVKRQGVDAFTTRLTLSSKIAKIIRYAKASAIRLIRTTRHQSMSSRAQC